MLLRPAVATRLVGAGGAVPVTVTVALRWMPLRLAVAGPLPADVPVKVVLAPVPAESVPGAVVVQDAVETSTGVPKASTPVAVNCWAPPTVTDALVGETVREARTPAAGADGVTANSQVRQADEEVFPPARLYWLPSQIRPTLPPLAAGSGLAAE